MIQWLAVVILYLHVLLFILGALSSDHNDTSKEKISANSESIYNRYQNRLDKFDIIKYERGGGGLNCDYFKLFIYSDIIARRCMSLLETKYNFNVFS